MNLQNRVEKLEGRMTDGCPDCGHIPGGTFEFTLTEGEVFDEHKPLIPMRLPEPERCERCGRITCHTFTISPAGREESDDPERMSGAASARELNAAVQVPLLLQ
jgi:hypothetical protein